MEVYVITEPAAISYLVEDDIDGFKELLAEDDTLLFSEPIEFNTEAEALAFCEGLGYGVNERGTIEKYPLRSFEPSDVPFIEAIREY